MSLYYYHQPASSNEQFRIYDYAFATVDSSALPGAYPYQRYFTISRTDTTLICKIYTDSDRTVLEDTMSIVCTNTKLRYIETCAAQLSTSGGGQTTAIVENLDLQTNTPPDAPNNPNPSDGQTNIGVPNVTLTVDVNDSNGDTMDVSFYDASDDSLIGTAPGVPSGDTCALVWEGLVCNTTYQWYAVADDGEDQTSSATFTFTTEACPFQFKFPLRSKTERKKR
jgi:hypothetical protein